MIFNGQYSSIYPSGHREINLRMQMTIFFYFLSCSETKVCPDLKRMIAAERLKRTDENASVCEFYIKC